MDSTGHGPDKASAAGHAGEEASASAAARGTIVEDYDAVVLGAGISGMVSASVLLGQGHRRVLLLDTYRQLGGNHVSLDIGPYSFDIGSFIFHEDSPFIRRFPFLLDQYLPFSGETGRINGAGVLASYPFDIRADIIRPGLVQTALGMASLAYSRLTRDPERSAEDFVAYWIGERLARKTGLMAYLHRFYGASPAEISGEFARKRMRWLSNNASISGQLRKLRQGKTPPNRSLVRPREGFGTLYAPAGAALGASGVEIRLGQDIRSLARHADGSLMVQGKGLAVRSRTVISTVPLHVSAAWCGLDADPAVRSLTLTSLFYSFSGQRHFPHHVLYNFSPTGLWKRLTMHSDCYGRAAGREYFSVEVVSIAGERDIEAADAAFRDHVRRYGLFQGDLVLEGSRLTENAYPVYLHGAGASAARMIEALGELGIHSFGRQGGFDYQPTADVSSETAETALGARPMAGS